MFEDRKDAGQKLARALEKYRGQDVIVLGIPRGGVEVGYYVARSLCARFSMVVSRKLPLPEDPETGFGALAEDGSTVLIERAARWLPQKEIEAIEKVQRAEIVRRIQTLRRGRPLPDLRDRTVILVDDGIAMGSTMRAAIRLCKNKKAKKIVVAAPVAGEDVAEEIAETVDELVVLEMPVLFQAVAQVYRRWYDVPDDEVLAIMDRWEKEEAPYAAFVRFFNTGHYFEAHEVLEPLWRAAQGRDRDFFQGLIQIAAVFVHLHKRNRAGAQELFEKARRHLKGTGPVYRGVRVPELLKTVAECIDKNHAVCPFQFSGERQEETRP